jgi:hypothetical protein
MMDYLTICVPCLFTATLRVRAVVNRDHRVRSIRIDVRALAGQERLRNELGTAAMARTIKWLRTLRSDSCAHCSP